MNNWHIIAEIGTCFGAKTKVFIPSLQEYLCYTEDLELFTEGYISLNHLLFMYKGKAGTLPAKIFNLDDINHAIVYDNVIWDDFIQELLVKKSSYTTLKQWIYEVLCYHFKITI